MDKCLTEGAFMKCECERCKSHRDSMVSMAVNKVIHELLLKSINSIFNKEVKDEKEN